MTQMNAIRSIEQISERFYVFETEPEPYQCSDPDCTSCGGVSIIWLLDRALKARVPFGSVELARRHASEMEER